MIYTKHLDRCLQITAIALVFCIFALVLVLGFSRGFCISGRSVVYMIPCLAKQLCMQQMWVTISWRIFLLLGATVLFFVLLFASVIHVVIREVFDSTRFFMILFFFAVALIGVGVWLYRMPIMSVEFHNTQRDESKISFFEDVRPLVVSLGSDCVPAGMSRQWNLRHYAFPFDWTIAPSVSGMCRFLNTRATDFFAWDHMQYRQPKERYLYPYLCEKVYDVNFVHEKIDADWMDSYPMLYKKYAKRVARFNDIEKYQGPVYFFRHGRTTKQEAFELYQVLLRRFKNKYFVLVVASCDDEFRSDWGCSRLKNFYHFTNEQFEVAPLYRYIYQMLDLV